MAIGWKADIYSENVDEEVQREVGAKYLETVGCLRSKWGIEIDEVLDIKVGIGELPEGIYFNAELSHPETYAEEMSERFTPVDGAEELIDESYPVPITEVVESAGHLVSSIPYTKETETSVEKVAANELFGALALGYEHPVLLENDTRIIERNLEVIDDVYSEYSGVDEMLPEFIEHKENIARRIESGESLEKVVEYEKSKFDGWKEDIQTLSDIDDYSKDDYFFGTFPEAFLKVHVRTSGIYSPDGVEPDTDTLRERVDWLKDLTGQELEEERRKSKRYASMEDRGYLVSRRLAIRDIEGEIDLPTSDLVQMGVDGVVDSIEDLVEGEDRRLRERFSIEQIE
ncbi:MAG: hypothetical protein H8Z69_05830 [Nanohaloarchaea archaeon]|nr:hypothetical protein [Candidatus Nanohaloarchaea archaeon]